MPKIPPCSRRVLIEKLRRLGFQGPFPGGKHSCTKRGNLKVTIPNPHSSDIDSEFVKELLKQAGIAEEDWLNA
jgi:predicted RNA binding protein YcfA (HicA-like mRNA interferase family)